MDLLLSVLRGLSAQTPFPSVASDILQNHRPYGGIYRLGIVPGPPGHFSYYLLLLSFSARGG